MRQLAVEAVALRAQRRLQRRGKQQLLHGRSRAPAAVAVAPSPAAAAAAIACGHGSCYRSRGSGDHSVVAAATTAATAHPLRRGRCSRHGAHPRSRAAAAVAAHATAWLLSQPWERRPQCHGGSSHSTAAHPQRRGRRSRRDGPAPQPRCSCNSCVRPRQLLSKLRGSGGCTPAAAHPQRSGRRNRRGEPAPQLRCSCSHCVRRGSCCRSRGSSSYSRAAVAHSQHRDSSGCSATAAAAIA